ncbi:MAG: pantoate--beta-alanine ligase [Alphaproteobacteria bacterium RIFCSPHIGHO2_12_FULL_45_9]|nr:MAG: pantoate--beta-alanine ligase [Alphaproteobacteria bacterium RIFCSPHIGHO2_02_FULL_46_13]OFW94922.1 MAG: pantoate--beta-alanine ligase [Alphaproteobacteria bacterium RIFCSPHIGHO2_12_FULL_45_9]
MLSILSTQHDLKNYIANKIAAGKTIGFVPTMGALHEGHLTLAREALAENDECIVSIFVNPKQFAPHEDFDKYPRTLDKDSALLEDIGVQSIFAPSVDVMYPPDFQSSVTVGNISKPLEGEFRPHFFTGVATVVTRLLLLVGAHKAYFGEKDYQQLQVIKALQRDLAIPTEIIGVPTVREASGLALSSRNAYLSPTQKDQALTIIRTLRHMADELKSGQPIAQIEATATENLLSAGFDKVDYMTIRDADTLLPPTPTTKSHRLLAAAWLGQTRLIDNIGVSSK